MFFSFISSLINQWVAWDVFFNSIFSLIIRFSCCILDSANSSSILIISFLWLIIASSWCWSRWLIFSSNLFCICICCSSNYLIESLNLNVWIFINAFVIDLVFSRLMLLSWGSSLFVSIFMTRFFIDLEVIEVCSNLSFDRVFDLDDALFFNKTWLLS